MGGIREAVEDPHEVQDLSGKRAGHRPGKVKELFPQGIIGHGVSSRAESAGDVPVPPAAVLQLQQNETLLFPQGVVRDQDDSAAQGDRRRPPFVATWAWWNAAALVLPALLALLARRRPVTSWGGEGSAGPRSRAPARA